VARGAEGGEAHYPKGKKEEKKDEKKDEKKRREVWRKRL
jgi:hypothetical protein